MEGDGHISFELDGSATKSPEGENSVLELSAEDPEVAIANLNRDLWGRELNNSQDSQVSEYLPSETESDESEGELDARIATDLVTISQESGFCDGTQKSQEGQVPEEPFDFTQHITLEEYHQCLEEADSADEFEEEDMETRLKRDPRIRPTGRIPKVISTKRKSHLICQLGNMGLTT